MHTYICVIWLRRHKKEEQREIKREHEEERETLLQLMMCKPMHSLDCLTLVLIDCCRQSHTSSQSICFRNRQKNADFCKFNCGFNRFSAGLEECNKSMNILIRVKNVKMQCCFHNNVIYYIYQPLQRTEEALSTSSVAGS